MNETRPPLSQDEINARMKEMTSLAMRLHDLMEYGMTFTISVLVKPAIIAQDQAPQVKSMIITKPAMHLTIEPQR